MEQLNNINMYLNGVDRKFIRTIQDTILLFIPIRRSLQKRYYKYPITKIEIFKVSQSISNKDVYFAVECYTGGNSSGKHSIEPIVFSKCSGNPIFGQIFGHQRAENEARNTKMYRGQETHPISVNARYEMNWANNFFKKFRKPHFRPNIWPPEGRKWGQEHKSV